MTNARELLLYTDEEINYLNVGCFFNFYISNIHDL
jgi:hypothetical protein